MKNCAKTAAVLLLVFSFFGLTAQSPEEMKLPLDPTVKYGVLENGLTYYIKHNEEPKNRASFYMIQNVGAILENDAQNGLAHFLEHMAFNGTEHFPGKGILNTLQNHGVSFGRNINAYTAQDETVYNLSHVPMDKPGLLDTCLLVLNDWSNFLLLTEEEIDAERGVISEEWRTRRTPDFRMMKKSMPLLYNGSKYAERDVIGDLDVIQNFEYDVIRDFYHDWYRTDLQAIAVVGDFDADEVELKVKELFSKIPAVENPKERGIVEIPENEKPLFGLSTDKEGTQSSISVYIRDYNADPGVENAVQYRDMLIESLFNSMMSQRIAELLQKGEPPFISGRIIRTSLTRNYDLTYISASAKPNEEELAFKTILEEVERVKQHGITSGELERAKMNVLNRMEKRVKEKDKISNDAFAREYQSHYLGKNAFMDIEVDYKLTQALFQSITVADFTQRIPAWFGEKNNVIIVQGPESEEISHLDETQAMAIYNSSKGMEVAPYEDVEVATSFITEELSAGSVVSTRKIEDLDAEEWTLSNGAKLIYRFADYEKDNIGFKAYSRGGASLYDDDYVATTDMLTDLVPFYGVGDYDQVMLQKMLSGKTVKLNLQLGELSEGMTGSASPKDFETLMQLIYLNFSKPRFDQAAHEAITGRYLAFVENMNKNPQKIMQDSLSMILTDYHPRNLLLNKDLIQKVDFEKIQEVYKDRYNDASDFTFFFVGNISKEELLPLAEKYIASLPSEGRVEDWIDRGVNEPEGTVKKKIELELSVPKSTVILVMNNEMDFSPENKVGLDVIKGILDLRYTESIREDEGGTYGVSTMTNLEHYPVEKANMMIMFDTDPEKADHLKTLVYKELEILMKEGPTAVDLDKTVKNMIKVREENKEHNSYWMNMLYNNYLHGYNFDASENYLDILNDLSAKDVKKLMKKMYKGANVVDITFAPKEVAAE